MENPMQKRLPQLDLLRALAVLLVVGNHMTVCPPETNFYVNKFTLLWNRGGWVGVDLFFVLSGFLISGLLFGEYQKSNDLNIKRFLIRRGFKIYPAFWFLMAVTCVVAVFYKFGFYRLGLLGELLFIQNYAPHLWEHTWTLAVEEHFYIGLCILFFALLKFKKSDAENPFAIVPKIFVVLAVCCLLLRFVTEMYLPFQYGRNIEPTHLRLDSLFFGVFLSYLWHFENLSENEFIRRNRFLIGLSGVLLLLPAFILQLETHVWIATIGLTLFYLGSGMLLIFALKTNFSRIPLANLIAYIGTFSYSIYLWNAPVQDWLSKAMENSSGKDNWFFYAGVYLSATFLIGILTSKIIEYPILKIRNKYFPSSVSPVITPS